MDLKRQCYFIYGADTYRAEQAVKAITTRFLSKPDSMYDFAQYDCDDTPLDKIKQTLLAVPFFVTHRLFVLKRPFALGKAKQEELVKLLETIGETTFVVLYEPGTPDRRVSLFQWLTKQTKCQDYPLPQGAALTSYIRDVAKSCNVTVAGPAIQQLSLYFASNTMQLAQEIHKLASACQSQGRTEINRTDVTELCQSTDEGSMFALGDALRQSSPVPLISLYRQQRQHEDPLAIAGFLASQIRTLAKIALAYQSGTRQPEAIARQTKLHPYVVKLAFPVASKLTVTQLQSCYQALVNFDRSAKNGSAPPELGLLLLIIHLHDTVIGKEARRVAGVT